LISGAFGWRLRSCRRGSTQTRWSVEAALMRCVI
jgi:hypothetical protein